MIIVPKSSYLITEFLMFPEISKTKIGFRENWIIKVRKIARS